MNLRTLAILFGLMVVMPVGSRLALAQQANPALKALIEGARKEGQLDLMITSSQGEKGAAELSEAFKKRFGLELKMNYDLSGLESQKINQAVAETKAGVPPVFDLMQSEPPETLPLLTAGGIELIENWEALLAEISPEAYKVKEKISPSILKGYGFLWGTRLTVMVYNPKLISEGEVPKMWKEMGNPKYRGAFSVPPWIGVARMGIWKYDKDEWLEIVKSFGRNKREVLTFTAGVQRMLLGELKFVEANTYEYNSQKASDANAPIEMRFAEDFSPLRQTFYFMRKGTRHPNAARLFALWATSPEANRIYEKYSLIENLALGTGPVTLKTVEKIKRQKVEPMSWFDSPQNLEKFRWLATDEGQKYQQAIAKAQREGN